MSGPSLGSLPNTAKIALALAALLATFLTPFSSAKAERVGLVTEIQSIAYGQPQGQPKVRKLHRDGVVMQETLETVPDGGIARRASGSQSRSQGFHAHGPRGTSG